MGSSRCLVQSLPRRSMLPSRTRGAAMVHTTDELQLAAAVVLPLLAYKVAAIIQRNQLQWYLDASIALATASLLVCAASLDLRGHATRHAWLTFREYGATRQLATRS